MPALDITPAQIRRIILTHTHPDHFGMAGWFQALCSESGMLPTVFMSAVEQQWANITWRRNEPTRRAFPIYLHACGMPDELLPTVANSMEDTLGLTFPHPVHEETLEAGSIIQIGERHFEAIHAPGHSDGQLMFYDAGDKLLLSGDHVLMKITPNIGLWPDSAPDPLGRFLASLHELTALDVRLALPGHKALITDWRGRLGELLAHHEARLKHTLEAVAGGASVYEASLKVFKIGTFSPHEWRFAMAETLAHLEYLRLRGQVQQDEDAAIWRFRPA